jgi:hypothetical protein
MVTRAGPQLGNWEGQCDRALERLGGALSESPSSFAGGANGAPEMLLRATGEQLREAAARVKSHEKRLLD